MRSTSFMPNNNEGIGNMLTAFATNIPGALATKYSVTPEQILSVVQAHLVWNWFEEVLVIARGWSASLTQDRDALSTGAPGTFDALPTLPTLPPRPLLPSPPSPPDTEAQIEHDFFATFSALVSAIKHNTHYDKADGVLLGIEGTPIPPPSPSVVPTPSAALVSSGQPEITCPKGPFQGFSVFLTRPGQARKLLGLSLTRHYLVTEPLPAPGTAEIWVFEVQYHYHNSPFGQVSQPVSITVRG